MSALIINDVPIECINQAAIQYHVPATLIISVLKTENGRVGTASQNANGTIDYGPMQINTIWINQLKKYGYTREQIQYDPCINIAVGTWILATHIAEGQTLWTGVGDYHSHTSDKNATYRHKVVSIYSLLTQYLSSIKKTF